MAIVEEPRANSKKKEFKDEGTLLFLNIKLLASLIKKKPAVAKPAIPPHKKRIVKKKDSSSSEEEPDSESSESEFEQEAKIRRKRDLKKKRPAPAVNKKLPPRTAGKKRS